MTIEKTGITTELNFLRTWGLAFRQAAKDKPNRPDYKRHEETCIDTHQALTGKKSCYNTDLKQGLLKFRNYLELLASENAFPDEIGRQHFANLASIEVLLFEEKQISLF